MGRYDCLVAALKIPVVPTVKRRAGDAELGQRHPG